MKNLKLPAASPRLQLYCYVRPILVPFKLTLFSMLLLLNTDLTGQTCDLTADFTFIVNICHDVQFSANTQTGVHTWEFGDGATSTATNPTYSYPLSSPGEFVVVHTVYLNGTYYTCAKVVQSECVDFFCPQSAEIKAVTEGCDIHLQTSVKQVIGWNFGDGSTGGGTSSISHTYASSGTYTITLTYVLNGQTLTCSFNVFVRCPCDAGFKEKLKYEPCQGIYVDFFSNCEEEHYYHTWNFGDGCSVEGYGEDIVSDTDPACYTSGTYANPTHAYNMNTYNNTNTVVIATHLDTRGVSCDYNPYPGIGKYRYAAGWRWYLYRKYRLYKQFVRHDQCRNCACITCQYKEFLHLRHA